MRKLGPSIDRLAVVHLHPQWLEHGFRVRVNPDHSFAVLHAYVRQRVNVKKEQAIFLFCNDELVIASETVRSVHARHAKNGVLDVTFCLENAFGGRSDQIEREGERRREQAR